MNFKERLKRLAGCQNSSSKSQKSFHDFLNDSSNANLSKKTHMNYKQFLNEITKDNILEEYLLKNKTPSVSKNEKKKEIIINENIKKEKEIQINTELIKKMALVSQKASQKNISSNKLKENMSKIIMEQNQPIQSFDFNPQQSIGGQSEVNQSSTGIDIAPIQQQTQTQPPSPPQTTTDLPNEKEKEKEEGEEKNKKEKKEKEEKKPEEENIKNQLISNIVKSVNKLTNFVDWKENLEDKIKYLVSKMKKNYGNENPIKNPFNALVILLNSVDKIKDKTLKDVIVNNYKKYLMNDPNIKNFIQKVWEGDLVDVEEEKGKEKEKEEAPVETEEKPKQETEQETKTTPEEKEKKEKKEKNTNQPSQTEISQEELSSIKF